MSGFQPLPKARAFRNLWDITKFMRNTWFRGTLGAVSTGSMIMPNVLRVLSVIIGVLWYIDDI